MNKTVKIYLKSMKKPICFEVENNSSFEKLYKDLMTNDVIKFGPVMFRRDDFIYAVID